MKTSAIITLAAAAVVSATPGWAPPSYGHGGDSWSSSSTSASWSSSAPYSTAASTGVVPVPTGTSVVSAGPTGTGSPAPWSSAATWAPTASAPGPVVPAPSASSILHNGAAQLSWMGWSAVAGLVGGVVALI